MAINNTGKALLITLAVLVGVLLLAGIVALILFLVQSNNFKAKTQQALATQSNLLNQEPVDLERYSGRWYEHARLPVRFEGPECTCVTADYTLKNNTVTVVNTCAGIDGKPINTARGVARPVNDNNTALRVSFGPEFLGDAIAGNYWIFYVDPAYQNAVVGSPDFRTMWVLSRSAKALPPDELQRLVSIGQQKGFDTSKLIFRSPSCTVQT